jgi:hypothetical protein
MPEGRITRKRHAPLDDNGEPVTVPIAKRRNVSEQTKKQTTVSTIPSKTAPPKKIAPTKRKPSVEIEEVSEEESFYAGPPQNPRNILEASDGSDDDNNFGPPSAGPPSSAPMDISDSDEEVEIVEKPEEDDEAELGLPVQSLNIKN